MRKLILFIATSLDDYIAGPGSEIDWLVGGGEIIRALLQDDLVDEMRIFVRPIVLGAGIPLFPPSLSVKSLNFKECHAFGTGLVRLTYES